MSLEREDTEKKFVSTDDPEKDEGVGLSAHACACHKDQSYISSIRYSIITIHLIVFTFFNMMIDDNIYILFSRINELKKKEKFLHTYLFLKLPWGFTVK